MKTSNLVIATIVLGMLTTTGVADEHAEDEQPEKVCINSNLIRNFDGLDDEHVFVEQSGKDYFLLTMRRRCTGLRSAQAIALNDTTSRICSGGFGEVIFRESGIGRTTCRIDKIERVENKDDARAIVAERKQWKKDQREMEKAEKKKKKEMQKAKEAAAKE